MRNLILKLSFTLMFGILCYSLSAQTQNINVGDTKNYSVDTEAPDDPQNGTPGSTYTWTVLDATNADITGTTMAITNQPGSTSGNRITIDWGTTPAGTYTLHVIETNNGCTGTEKFINVIISEIGMPDFAAGNTVICSGDDTTFEITNAPANSVITFTVTGGTAVPASPITTDASGNATITVTHDGTSPQIVVTLTEMTLEDGTTIVDIDPDIVATTDVTIIETSDIDFD